MSARNVLTITSQDAGGWQDCDALCRLLLLLTLLGLFLEPEDGTGKFLRNVRLLTHYTAVKFRENLKSKTFLIIRNYEYELALVLVSNSSLWSYNLPSVSKCANDGFSIKIYYIDHSSRAD
jgi:hypothetical protein